MTTEFNSNSNRPAALALTGRLAAVAPGRLREAYRIFHQDDAPCYCIEAPQASHVRNLPQNLPTPAKIDRLTDEAAAVLSPVIRSNRPQEEKERRLSMVAAEFLEDIRREEGQNAAFLLRRQLEELGYIPEGIDLKKALQEAQEDDDSRTPSQAWKDYQTRAAAVREAGAAAIAEAEAEARYYAELAAFCEPVPDVDSDMRGDREQETPAEAFNRLHRVQARPVVRPVQTLEAEELARHRAEFTPEHLDEVMKDPATVGKVLNVVRVDGFEELAPVIVQLHPDTPTTQEEAQRRASRAGTREGDYYAAHIAGGSLTLIDPAGFAVDWVVDLEIKLQRGADAGRELLNVSYSIARAVLHGLVRGGKRKGTPVPWTPADMQEHRREVPPLGPGLTAETTRPQNRAREEMAEALYKALPQDRDRLNGATVACNALRGYYRREDAADILEEINRVNPAPADDAEAEAREEASIRQARAKFAREARNLEKATVNDVTLSDGWDLVQEAAAALLEADQELRAAGYPAGDWYNADCIEVTRPAKRVVMAGEELTRETVQTSPRVIAMRAVRRHMRRMGAAYADPRDMWRYISLDALQEEAAAADAAEAAQLQNAAGFDGMAPDVYRAAGLAYDCDFDLPEEWQTLFQEGEPLETAPAETDLETVLTRAGITGLQAEIIRYRFEALSWQAIADRLNMEEREAARKEGRPPLPPLTRDKVKDTAADAAEKAARRLGISRADLDRMDMTGQTYNRPAKAVVMANPETGETLRRFPSATAASKATGVNRGNISATVAHKQGRTMAGGVVWVEDPGTDDGPYTFQGPDGTRRRVDVLEAGAVVCGMTLTQAREAVRTGNPVNGWKVSKP